MDVNVADGAVTPPKDLRERLRSSDRACLAAMAAADFLLDLLMFIQSVLPSTDSSRPPAPVPVAAFPAVEALFME